jgi:hypothetical protein
MSAPRTPSVAKVCAGGVLALFAVCGACALITSFNGLTGSPVGAVAADGDAGDAGGAALDGDAAIARSGTSEAGCEAGMRACGGICVDPSGDNANCGACGVACSAAEGQSCKGGQCGSSCSGSFSTTQALCGNAGGCVDLTSTSADCSRCGNDCGKLMPGSVCLNGACVCPAGARQSGNSCLAAGLTLLTNVGWTATSSVPAAESGADSSPANVLDGNECTRFSTGASQQSGDWLELDLGAATKFDEVVLDGFLDRTEFPAAFSILVSNDGTSWGAAIASGTGSGTATGVIGVTFPEQTARYLRVQLTASATNPWAVDELRLYSAQPPQDTPIPLPRSQWNATASPSAATAPLALDGIPSTHFAIAPGTAGDWFQVDLGTFVTFDELTMNSYDSCFDSARTYTVSVSNDGATWQELFMGDGTGPIVTGTFSAQTARYVRVELTMSFVQDWSIGEFNLYMPSY